ncbi:MAG: ribose-phosphate diphosphokinase [Deltaproteobacteria bacterium]|nr:ribose-phosphate diphosphokinase [Deltaproteobacteria bacterium]
MKIDHPLIFSIHSAGDQADALASAGGFERGHLERCTFPDGEVYHRIASEAGGRHAVLVGSTAADEDTLELYDLACGLVKHGAESLTLVIPFFGYSTMERAVHPGEIVKAKTRARLLSSIPTAARGNRVFLLDLHSAGIAHYFEGGIVPVHLYARPIVVAAARRLAGSDFVLACTDAGRAKWVESLANDLGVTAAFVFKRRLDGTRTEITGVSAAVADRDVIIYDDMIRTGGSLLDAARAYQAAGARRIWAIATHGLFPGDALSRLKTSGLFEAIVVTDSHPRARQLETTGFLHVEPVAPLLAQAISGTA